MLGAQLEVKCDCKEGSRAEPFGAAVLPCFSASFSPLRSPRRILSLEGKKSAGCIRRPRAEDDFDIIRVREKKNEAIVREKAALSSLALPSMFFRIPFKPRLKKKRIMDGEEKKE